MAQESFPNQSGSPVTLGKVGTRPLSFEEARQSPCMSCGTSPCCTHLHLQEFDIRRLIDVDMALYFLNFEGIRIALTKDRRATIYLHQPCGLLDDKGLCSVHNTDEQPSICSHYPAHFCSYRTRMTVEVDSVVPMLDWPRMRWLADQITFDDDREIVSGPDWDDMLAAFAHMPLDRSPAPPPPPDRIYEEWRSIVLSPAPPGGVAAKRYRITDANVSDPCTGCDAWCCSTLAFGRPLPPDMQQVDFIRYALGFPGVEVGVSQEGWALIVRTACRHLQDNRCSIYGHPERPLNCSDYNELACTFRKQFGTPRPEDIVRIRRDQFPVLAQTIRFNETGKVIGLPTVNLLRQILEDAERSRAGIGSPSPS